MWHVSVDPPLLQPAEAHVSPHSGKPEVNNRLSSIQATSKPKPQDTITGPKSEMQLRRADTSLVDDAASAHIAYHDKYVVVYDFANAGSYTKTRT
jgi:hypothetical protein